VRELSEDILTDTENRITNILKLIYTGEGSPWLSISQEKRTGGLLSRGYLNLSASEPDFIQKLNQLVTVEESPDDKEPIRTPRVALKPSYYWHMSDAIDKLGFMVLAYDCIIDAVKRDVRLSCQYNFYCFIFLTKAFLDAISMFLNEEYQLNMPGPSVDITKASFVDKIGQEKQGKVIVKNLAKYRSWLSRVHKYRKGLIHQKPAEVFGKRGEIHVPRLPSFIGEPHFWNSVEIRKLITEWVKNSVEILELICNESILRLFKYQDKLS